MTTAKVFQRNNEKPVASRRGRKSPTINNDCTHRQQTSREHGYIAPTRRDMQLRTRRIQFTANGHQTYNLDCTSSRKLPYIAHLRNL